MRNLETRWIDEDGPKVAETSEAFDRLGSLSTQCVLLSGGLANHNYDLGDERILRIYKRSSRSSTIDLELKLNDRRWQSFNTAKTIAQGADYLVQKKLYFSELLDSSEHGSIAGKALGEIHSAPVSLVQGHNEFLSLIFSTSCLSKLISEKLNWAISSKEFLLDSYKEWLAGALELSVQLLSVQIDLSLKDRVLLHGDCKPSNIKKCSQSFGAVVFDWEFSFAGPRLIDIGHFLRWGVSSDFLEKFVYHYKNVTGVDLSDKLQAAKLIDLVNLSFQLAKSTEGSLRETDILNHLETLVPATIHANKPLQRTRKRPLVVV